MWFASQTMEDVMAKVIEFYIPKGFKQKAKFVATEQKGIVIVFPLDLKKSA